MNEKHYDNLCEIAQNTSEPGAQLFAELASMHYASSGKSSRADHVRRIAQMYNTLDILCIVLDCEDEVQDVAEQLAIEKLASKA